MTTPPLTVTEQSRTTRPRVIAAALAAFATLTVTAMTAPAVASAATPGGSVSVIVRGHPCGAAALDTAIAGVGGRVTHELGIIDGAAATVPAAGLPSLAASGAVAQVTPDLPVTLTSDPSGYNQSTDTGSAYNTTLMSGAQNYWQAGYTGRGVDIAIIDSGVAPVNGLSAPGKVLNGPDLSFESQAPNLAHLDTFGHGTHLSGLMAGRDDAAVPGQYAGDSTNFVGMAPDARIVSVKVADSQGRSDVSQVVFAIGWVVQHSHDPGMNIRVLNMSFSTDSVQSYLVDPLAYATENAWHSGIVVTAAAGNAGARTQLYDPAFDPYVIAVGSANTQGTNNYANHTVASFSQGGDGNRNPDLLAPGIHLESLRDPNSYIDTNYPGGRINARFFRGSGTSQSSAIVAGAAALILQQNPLLTPDQVKSLLTSTATPLSLSPAVLQGNGELNLRGALYALPPVAVQLFAPSTGTGSLDGARGSFWVSHNGVALRGETDIMGNPVNTGALATLLKNGTAWSGGVVNGAAWSGNTWSGNTWSGNTWSGNTWSGDAWSGNTWSGNTWSGNTWSGNTWSGNTWSGNTWSGNTWSGNTWSTGSWD
jgi:serine protease AprX